MESLAGPEVIMAELENRIPYDLKEMERAELQSFILQRRSHFWQHRIEDGQGISAKQILEYKERVIQRSLEMLDNGSLMGHSTIHAHSHSKRKPGKDQPGMRKIPNGPCVNFDFEACDWSGWEMTTGQVNRTPF